MIDKTREFWHGDCAEDIIEYLDEYSENEIDKTVIVKCDQCGSLDFACSIDDEEGAIEVACAACGKKRMLLDSADYWEDSDPKNAKCPLCKNKLYNVAVGFVHREDREVKWVYIGNRCNKCGLLGSPGDWEVNYAPTDEMERNA